jgi:hypothetical protein
MSELHQSPHQRKLIAEINAPFKPDFVVLDGIDAFVDGGPATGKRAQGNVFPPIEWRLMQSAWRYCNRWEVTIKS